MRTIFVKAEKLTKLVKLEAELPNKAYFDVDGKKVCLALKDGKYTHLESCTCTHHSLHGPMPQVNMTNLCSYVLAVYKRLPIK